MAITAKVYGLQRDQDHAQRKMCEFFLSVAQVAKSTSTQGTSRKVELLQRDKTDDEMTF